jgi:hypothetical protein
MVALAAAAAMVSAEAACTATIITGNSSGAVTGMARKSPCPPEKQRPAYTSVNRSTTFLAPLRARCKVRLPLPFRFVDTMGGNMLTHTIVEECSGGQPLYPIEIFHDGEGKSYLRDGWPKFVEDYDLKLDWSLIFSHRDVSNLLCICVVDSSYCARAYSAWA